MGYFFFFPYVPSLLSPPLFPLSTPPPAGEPIVSLRSVFGLAGPKPNKLWRDRLIIVYDLRYKREQMPVNAANSKTVVLIYIRKRTKCRNRQVPTRSPVRFLEDNWIWWYVVYIAVHASTDRRLQNEYAVHLNTQLGFSGGQPGNIAVMCIVQDVPIPQVFGSQRPLWHPGTRNKKKSGRSRFQVRYTHIK